MVAVYFLAGSIGIAGGAENCLALQWTRALLGQQASC